MTSFRPELIEVMKSALDEAMTKVPEPYGTVQVKAYLAECICKAAAQGITTYDGLVNAAGAQLQTIISMFS